MERNDQKWDSARLLDFVRSLSGPGFPRMMSWPGTPGYTLHPAVRGHLCRVLGQYRLVFFVSSIPAFSFHCRCSGGGWECRSTKTGLLSVVKISLAFWWGVPAELHLNIISFYLLAGNINSIAISRRFLEWNSFLVPLHRLPHSKYLRNLWSRQEKERNITKKDSVGYGLWLMHEINSLKNFLFY